MADPPNKTQLLEPNPSLGGTEPMSGPCDATLAHDPRLANTLHGEKQTNEMPVFAPLEPNERLGETEPVQMRWTPEEYGRFCADLDSAYHRHDVLQRWRIKSEEVLAEVQLRWRRRFDRDRAQRARFVAALQAAREDHE